MIYRSRAPLRIGLAGGGTDVSPYSDIYGGAVLNAAINLYAYANITPLNSDKIILRSFDKSISVEFKAGSKGVIDGDLDLLKGVYNRILRDYSNDAPLSFELSTYVDAPAGSGLGTSSTLVVAILGAFVEWLKLPLGEYDISHLAYEIERIDLAMAGGKQDQFAATFGGFNYMEFYKDDKVVVNPLRIKRDYINELEHRLLLYYTGTSRLSSEIIEQQNKNVTSQNKDSISAMHRVKEQALKMKEAILTGRLDDIGEILDFGWRYKKQMAEGITNPMIDEIYSSALNAGASGGKVSGAGGGGFIMFYCPQNARYEVIRELSRFNGEFRRFMFSDKGLTTWRG